MQVSQVQDHVSHAVIGGKETIDFDVSSSAEFFNIMSSSLYTDQILAVVREVICNAWDAHIEAGCKDKPVEVTLTKDSFTVKDYGNGIHQDDFGVIYGIYGNSTKKNDGDQTGGFGLGCKAPFAYAYHFEVISCHSGVKTIYSLAKSSAQSMGKPGITKIASFPSSETGLTVTVRLKNPVDCTRFNILAHRIIHNGDMNVLLNGVKVQKLDFDTSKGNYLITNQIGIFDTQPRIMVRYGNVIYPVNEAKEIQPSYNRVVTILNNLRGRLYSTNEYCLVFQAPPHSIAVTPSRESLSMQEHTVKTLNALFKEFLDSIDGPFKANCDEYADLAIKQAVEDKAIGQLLDSSAKLPRRDGLHTQMTRISDFQEMAKQFMSTNYPDTLEFRKTDIKRRLSYMVQENLVDRGMVQTYLRALDKVKVSDQARNGRYFEKSSWFQKNISVPLLTKLQAAELSKNRFFVCTRDDMYWRGLRSKYDPNYLVPLNLSVPQHLIETLPFFRKIVVIATSKKDLIERTYERFKDKNLGEYLGFFFYLSSRKLAELEKARSFFKSRGMVVIDLTEKTKEEMAIAISKPPVVRAPKKKGLVCLSALKTNTGISIFQVTQEDAARIENPEFVIQVPTRQNVSKYSLPDLDSATSKLVVALFGDKGGVATTSTQVTSYVAKGAKVFKEYITEKVCDYVLNSASIREYYTQYPDRIDRILYDKKVSLNTRSVVNLVLNHKIFGDYFGIKNNLTELDLDYLALWRSISENKYYWDTELVRNTNQELMKIRLSSDMGPFIGKLIRNKSLQFMDVYGIHSFLKKKGTNSAEGKKIVNLVIQSFNN